MTAYEEVQDRLRGTPRRWLVTGVAGFIGSNLLQALLELDQDVVGLDNFATGRRTNLDEVRELVGPERWSRFRFVDGDVASPDVCRDVLEGVSVVLHQAALGSVPRSIEEPLATNTANVTGTLALLEGARQGGVRRFVYASSSSVYGDNERLPKREDELGHLLSPYAVTKLADELYADTYGRLHGLETVGLRYFNVFGPRQDPEGAYAAVIPAWVAAMIRGDEVQIHGTGETSRDFCYIRNVVEANVLAASVEDPAAVNQAYNVAVGARTTLNELYEVLREKLLPRHPQLEGRAPLRGPFRSGDVLHSLADIDKARHLLGYAPAYSLEQGLNESLEWYERNLS